MMTTMIMIIIITIIFATDIISSPVSWSVCCLCVNQG